MMTENDNKRFDEFCKLNEIEPGSVEQGIALAAWQAALGSRNVTFMRAGRYCKSEDDCIAAGIRFGDYEKGANDAIAACERILNEGRPLRGVIDEETRKALRVLAAMGGPDEEGETNAS